MINKNNILLCSLGTSWAIVPEAFYLPGVTFSEVHIITTESAKDLDKIVDFFNKNASDVILTITRVDGFVNLNSEQDHSNFEEVLYRWVLEKRENTKPLPYICLAGGFKTMPLAMQKAAELFGCKQLFHVLCNTDPPPNTSEEILNAKNNNKLVWIQLGVEPGWYQFKNLSSLEYELNIVNETGIIRSVRAGDDRLRTRIRDLMERSLRLSDSFDRIHNLPFSVLATWSRSDLDWLEGQLTEEEEDIKWLEKLPKIELHCHLGGFATHGDLLKKVRSAAEDSKILPELKEPQFPQGWPKPRTIIDLNEYFKLGDATGSAILYDVGCLKKHCELLYEHFLNDNVIYAEVRCSPANYAKMNSNGKSPWQILEIIRETFQNCMEEAERNKDVQACHINLILIATRRPGGDYRANISRHLALAVTAYERWGDGCRVVGVDLAGYEDKETRAHYYTEEFVSIHRCGIAITVHAGENDDAEAIWQAVFNLNARRLGHALSLSKSLELSRSIADRKIAVELCPYSNYQIKGYKLYKDGIENDNHPEYPINEYLKKGIKVTINTDNIGISNASLTDNFAFLAKLSPGITRRQVLQILRNSVDSTFIPADEQTKLQESIEEKLLPSPNF